MLWGERQEEKTLLSLLLCLWLVNLQELAYWKRPLKSHTNWSNLNSLALYPTTAMIIDSSNRCVLP